jgi:hypothetical protein
MLLKIQCAWCSTSMGTKEAGPGSQPLHSITHSIYSNCARELLEQIKIAPQQNHEILKNASPAF